MKELRGGRNAPFLFDFSQKCGKLIVCMNFHMIIGIVGAGKSTYVKRLQKRLLFSSAVVCPDDIRAELTGNASDQFVNEKIFAPNGILEQRIRQNFYHHDNVIYDATNYKSDYRKNVLTLAKSLGCRIVAHVLRTPVDICIRNNDNRDRVVPITVLVKQFMDFEEPSMREGFNEIWSVPYEQTSIN